MHNYKDHEHHIELEVTRLKDNTIIFDELICKTFTNVEIDLVKDIITFTTSTGEIYDMFHNQNCCESVSIDDVVGDPTVLLGSPILRAEERSSESCPGKKNQYGYDDDFNETMKEDESLTWTFYEFATLKGAVTIKWYGTANGYYSESVEICKRTGGNGVSQTWI